MTNPRNTSSETSRFAALAALFALAGAANVGMFTVTSSLAAHSSTWQGIQCRTRMGKHWLPS